jgi:hypothetical protein
MQDGPADFLIATALEGTEARQHGEQQDTSRPDICLIPIPPPLQPILDQPASLLLVLLIPDCLVPWDGMGVVKRNLLFPPVY